MGDVIDELLARDDATTSKPASSFDITAVATKFDAPLPESLLKLWRASDGLAIDPLDAHIPGPAEVLQLVADDAWNQQLVDRGFLPVLDDHQSNYLTLCVRNPLAFRVLHLPHDDGARVLYRDFESCLRSLIEAVVAGATADMFLFETDGDYPSDEPRPQQDQDDAKAMLAGPNERGEWNHAARLLDESTLNEWARLLETDHFVRRDVRARMQKMQSPAIRELLQKDERAFEDFALTFMDAVRGAGLCLGERQLHCVRVSEAWYNLEAFFHRRSIPDAAPRMVTWIKDQLAGRNPYDRPGNFMTD
jgi:hypothetical protein